MNVHSDQRIVHETVLRDIVSLIAGGKDTIDPDKIVDRITGTERNQFSYKNISRVAKDLTLTFPVIISDAVSVETASMISRAVERKTVGMLQMLFSAIQVSNAGSALEYLKNFHTNLDTDHNMGVDDWIGLGNQLVTREEVERYANLNIDQMIQENPVEYIKDTSGKLVNAITQAGGKVASGVSNTLSNVKDRVSFLPKFGKDKMNDAAETASKIADKIKGKEEEVGFTITDEKLFVEAITNFIQLKDFYLEENYSERSLNDYSINRSLGTVMETALPKEDKGTTYVMNIPVSEEAISEEEEARIKINGFLTKTNSLDAALNEGPYDTVAAANVNNTSDPEIDNVQRIENDARREYDRDPNGRNTQNYLAAINTSSQLRDRSAARARANAEFSHSAAKARKDIYDTFNKQIVPSDVAKANELVPTMMIINFVSTKGDTPISSTAIIGVKARLQYVSSSDMMERLVSKNEDKNGLFSFIKATTGQVSFWKDFVFAIKKAKVDSVATSGKGSSSPVWKMLEHRAIMSKFRRWTGSVNDAAAITSLVFSKAEADYLKKYERMDIMRSNTAHTIMNAYNIMALIVVDENTEKVHFLYDDGSGSYETMSFSHLERQGNGADGAYKKVINLLTKR